MDLERNLPTKRKRPPEFPNPWKANRHKQKQSRTGRQKAKRESIKAKSKTQTHEQPKAQSPCICHLIAPLQKKKKTTNNTMMQRQHSAEFVDPRTIPVVGGAH
jgi:hypothetical protein